MAQKNESKKISTGTKVGIGAGVAAIAAAAAAGAYYFYGSKDGAKNRKAMRGWVVKAKGEVMEKMETLKDVTETNYDKIVDEVVKRYSAMKKIDPVEVAALASELRGSWKRIAGHVATVTRPQLKAGTSSRTSKPKAKTAAKK